MFSRQKKVVVIVEKVVGKQTIRSLSHLVKIPGHKVDFLTEVPLSAHPYGTSPIGFNDFAYGEDYEFRIDFSKAIQSKTELGLWMHKWGLDQSHASFLNRVGSERIKNLKKQIGVSADQITYVSIRENEVTLTERLIISASRILAEKIKDKKIDMVLAGIGVSHLTAWLVYRRLKAEGITVQLLTETGYYGYEPIEGDPYIFNFGNLHTNSKQSSFVEILCQFVGDSNHSCLAILSAAQIDEQGNLNSTKIPDKNLFLTGSGGANDIASVASDVVVMMSGDSKKFVKKVPYITSPGDKVSTIFTNVAVLTRNNFKKSLNNLLPRDLDFDEEVNVMNEPTIQELEWLRSFDPQNEFLS